MKYVTIALVVLPLLGAVILLVLAALHLVRK